MKYLYKPSVSVTMTLNHYIVNKEKRMFRILISKEIFDKYYKKKLKSCLLSYDSKNIYLNLNGYLLGNRLRLINKAGTRAICVTKLFRIMDYKKVESDNYTVKEYKGDKLVVIIPHGQRRING